MKTKLLFLTLNVSILLIPSAHASKRSTQSATAASADGKVTAGPTLSIAPAATKARELQAVAVVKNSTKLSRFTKVTAQWRMKTLDIEDDLLRVATIRAFNAVIDPKLESFWVRPIVYQEHKARLVELFKEMYQKEFPADPLYYDPLSYNEAALERKATALTNDLLLYWYNSRGPFSSEPAKQIYKELKKLHDKNQADQKSKTVQLTQKKHGQLSKHTKITALCAKEFKEFSLENVRAKLDGERNEKLYFAYEQENKQRFTDLFIKIYKRELPADALAQNDRALKRKAREITDETFHLGFTKWKESPDPHLKDNHRLIDEIHVFDDQKKVLEFCDFDELSVPRGFLLNSSAIQAIRSYDVENNDEISTEALVATKVLSEVTMEKSHILANKTLAQLGSRLMNQRNVSGNLLYYIELINRLAERYLKHYDDIYEFNIHRLAHDFYGTYPYSSSIQPRPGRDDVRKILLRFGRPSDYWWGRIGETDTKHSSCDAAAKDYEPSLLEALTTKDAVLVRLLLERKADPDETYDFRCRDSQDKYHVLNNQPLLHCALRNEDAASVRSLLEHKADPNATYDNIYFVDKRTYPLSREAIRNKDAASLRLLLEHKADPNATFPADNSSWERVYLQPLLSEVVQHLTGKPQEVDPKCETLARLLLEHKADPNTQVRGISLLQQYGRRKYSVAAKLLLEFKADPKS